MSFGPDFPGDWRYGTPVARKTREGVGEGDDAWSAIHVPGFRSGSPGSADFPSVPESFGDGRGRLLATPLQTSGKKKKKKKLNSLKTEPQNPETMDHRPPSYDPETRTMDLSNNRGYHGKARL